MEDEHDRRRISHVRPESWENPVPETRYHLVVLGAGTAGLVTAAAAAGLGARVALVEKGLMGGDCLNVGCVPSKGMIRAARAWRDARRSGEFGGPPAKGDGDFVEAMRRMRRIRADISPVDGAARFRDLGVDVFLGEGKFTGPDTLEVGRARLTFRRAVIATGARAIAPPIEGLEEAGYLTNETVFSLEEPPRRLAVIGAGPIGCELGQAFARLGSEVTLLEKADQVLPREDPDAAAVLEEAMARDGVDLVLGCDIARVERKNDAKVLHHGKETIVDEILVGAGRAPNVDGIGLEAADVEFDPSGVQVDDFLRTTSPRIYAAGDVASRFRFTHAADFMARAVVQNTLFFGRARMSRLVIPWCTYTSPEVAHVGAHAGDRTETITVPMEEVDRAVIDGDPEGFFRVHLRRGTDEILGATLVGDHAGDMIGEIALAMTASVGLSQIGKTIHPYPTRAEIFRKAADAWNRGRLPPRVRRLLSLWFRIVS